ncbi:hypothetical protein KKI24_30935 [bacterium]|nr:hypothetical protein [bacterium]
MIKRQSAKWLFLAFIAITWLQPAQARDLFGRVQVEKGTLVIVRNTETVTIQSPEAALIQKNDLLMAGHDSLITWQIDQKSSLQTGSNAVLMVRTWQGSGASGYISLGYGIARVQVDSEQGSRAGMVLKTPAAMIWTTGSIWIQVTASGNTLVKSLAGITAVNNRMGDGRSIEENQLVLVVNGELIVPDSKETARINQIADQRLMDMPDITSPQASSLINEAELITAGVLKESAVKQSNTIEPSLDESFDEQQDTINSNRKSVPHKQPVDENLAVDLEAFNNMTAIEIESESDFLGVVLVREEKPENVFSEFDKPKTPGNLFDLDDKTSWSSESGLLSITFEK